MKEVASPNGKPLAGCIEELSYLGLWLHGSREADHSAAGLPNTELPTEKLSVQKSRLFRNGRPTEHIDYPLPTVGSIAGRQIGILQ